MTNEVNTGPQQGQVGPHTNPPGGFEPGVSYSYNNAAATWRRSQPASGQIAPMPMRTGQISAAQQAYFAARTAAIQAQQAVAQSQLQAQQMQLEAVKAIEAARKSPQNITDALAERQKAATDYQYELAGLPKPAEAEAQVGIGIGIRPRIVGAVERTQRDYAIKTEEATTTVAGARAAAAGADAQADFMSINLQREEASERSSRQAEADYDRQMERQGLTYDPETQRYIPLSQARVFAAQRGVTFDEINREFTSRGDLLGRTDPFGNVMRKSDGIWVDQKSGNEYINNQWVNRRDGTFLASDGVWYDGAGDWYDGAIKSWRQAGTGFVQQGIYWMNPATGQRFWQNQPVQAPGAGVDPALADIAAKLGALGSE